MTRTLNNKITKKQIKELDLSLSNMTDYNSLDKERALAWHPCTGLMVGEWMNIMEKYGEARKRKLYFATNNYGMITCFFDANNNKEFNELMEKEREDYRLMHGLSEEDRAVNREVFLNPKKAN